MSEVNFFRLIDAYFDGSIGPVEKLMLKKRIENDPLLKAEFDLQKNIVDGLATSRKMALKARLSAIDVTTTPSLISSLFNAKVAVGTLALFAALGLWIFWPIDETDYIAPVDLSISDSFYLTQTTLPSIPGITQSQDQVAENAEKDESAPFITALNQGATALKTDTKEEKGAKVKPQSLVSFEDDKLFEHREDIEQLKLKPAKIDRMIEIDISLQPPVVEEKFHYKYFNNKLYLYGNFDDQPYEILELNRQGKRDLYLSYKNNIYVIEENITEINQLIKLDNPMLIKELTLIINE